MKKSVYVAAAAVIVIICVFAASGFLSDSVSVESVYPVAAKVESYINCSGRLVENTKNEVRMGTGTIMEIYVSAGDYVKEGDKLFLYKIQSTGLSEPKIEFATAQISGTVTEFNYVKFEDITAAKNVCVIADISLLKLIVYVGESNISKIKVGQRALIKPAADDDKQFFGTVEKIAPVAKTVTANGYAETCVEVQISVSDAGKLLRAGYTASVKIVTEERENSVIVPFFAVFNDENGEYVMKIENGKKVRQPVITGLETLEGIEILDGLNGDELLIYSNSEDISNKNIKPKRN